MPICFLFSGFRTPGNYFNRQPLIEFVSTDELHETVEAASPTIDNNNSSMQQTNRTSIDANQLKERNSIKCKNDLNLRKRKRRRRRKRRQTNDTQFASLLNSENSTNVESTTANIQMRPFITGNGNACKFFVHIQYLLNLLINHLNILFIKSSK